MPDWKASRQTGIINCNNFLTETLMLKRRFIAFFFLIVLFPALTAFAEEPQKNAAATVPVQITDQMKAFDAEYKKASATLTEDQLKKIDALDAEFTKTIEPAAQVIDMAGKMEMCEKKGLVPKEYGEKFSKFIVLKDKEKDAMVDAFFQKELPAVDYIDHMALKKHLAFGHMLQMQIMGGMVKIVQQSYEKEPIEKITAICDAAKKEIEDYIIGK
jgi:hypothetical protein